MTNQLAPALAEIGERVAQAHAARTPLRIVGSGTWLGAGRPVAKSERLSTSALSDVIEYVPGDLVITVGAGTTLATIGSVTAEHGQWLALDPIGDLNSTIGATIATASSGPLSLGSGTIRDLVLGLGVITGEGKPIRVGGRVVKNVAGFDLTRLSTGAFGTLGVVTEVSLRLHARPPADSTFAIAHTDRTVLLEIVAKLGLGALAWQALELLNPQLARAVGAASGDAWVLLARATGNAAGVAAQRSALALLGDVHEPESSTWQSLRQADGSGATFRVTAAPALLSRTIGNTLDALAKAGLAHARVRATPHRGTVRVIVPPTDDATAVAAQHLVATVRALSTDAQRVLGERLPEDAWHVLPGATLDPVSRRLRVAFDPHHILNRGIFGELTE